MVDPEYPCALCGCAAWKHYTSIGTGQPVCLICTMDSLVGSKNKKATDSVHEFIPDNLRWLEMKAMETFAQKGMPGITHGS